MDPPEAQAVVAPLGDPPTVEAAGPTATIETTTTTFMAQEPAKRRRQSSRRKTSEMTTEDAKRALEALKRQGNSAQQLLIAAGGANPETPIVAVTGEEATAVTATTKPQRRKKPAVHADTAGELNPDAKRVRRKSRPHGEEGPEKPRRKSRPPVEPGEEPKPRPRKKKPTTNKEGQAPSDESDEPEKATRPRKKKPAHEPENDIPAPKQRRRRPSVDAPEAQKLRRASIDAPETTNVSSAEDNPKRTVEPKPRRRSTKSKPISSNQEQDQTNSERPTRPKKKKQEKIHQLGSVEQELLALVAENQRKKAAALGVGVALDPIQEGSPVAAPEVQEGTNPLEKVETGTVPKTPQEVPMVIPAAPIQEQPPKKVKNVPIAKVKEEGTQSQPPKSNLGSSASSFHTVNLGEDSEVPSSPKANDPNNNTEAPVPDGVPMITLLTEKTQRHRKKMQQQKAAREAPVDLLSQPNDSPQDCPLPSATDALLLVEDRDPVDAAYNDMVERHHAREEVKRKRDSRRRALIVATGFLVVVGIYLAIHTILFGWSSSGSGNPPTTAPALGSFSLPAGVPEQSLAAIQTDRASPQYKAYEWLSRDPNRNSYDEWQLLQRYAVATMVFALRKSKGQTSISNMFTDSDPWLDYDLSECEWGGPDLGFRLNPPSCDDKGRIRNLELSLVSGVQGDFITSIPADISLLDHLERLSIAQNGVFVTWGDLMPPEIELLASKFRTLDVSQNEIHLPIDSSSPLFRLSNLESLDASQNLLTGKLPGELGSLDNLRHLDLSRNSLSGSLPQELSFMDKLEVLSLNSNSFAGGIPSVIWSMKSLTALNLGETSLTGKIPSELGLLSSSLESLDLSKTSLSGNIPTEIGLLRARLKNLDLSSNSLSGPIPTTMGTLTSLLRLSLSLSAITGGVPTHLGELQSAEEIDISNTLLGGTLPPQLGRLTSLQSLKLAGNEHTGPLIPDILLIGALKNVDLSQNSLSGSIPAELVFLSNLEFLDLGSNLLSGRPPLDLAQQMTSLQVLRLGNNFINGTIASELGLLTQLVEIDLSSTSMTGEIPSEIGLLTNLEVLRLSSNLFRGALPVQFGNLSSLRHVELQGTDITGVIPSTFCGPTLQTLTVNCDNVQCGSRCKCKCE